MSKSAGRRGRRQLADTKLDVNTTVGIYGHRDQTDLEVAIDVDARWLEDQRENENVSPENEV